MAGIVTPAFTRKVVYLSMSTITLNVAVVSVFEFSHKESEDAKLPYLGGHPRHGNSALPKDSNHLLYLETLRVHQPRSLLKL